MKVARLSVLVLGFLFLGALTPAEGQQELPRHDAKVVLRISRDFLVKLTRQQFAQDQPINTESMGATVVGTAHVAGGYGVKLYKHPTECDFDLLVNGDITTQMVVTRKPVRVCLHGTAPFQAARRVVFDGKSFMAQPVGAGVCYHSTLDEICPLRNGPAAPLIRCVARPIVLRSLPEADASADQEIRGQIGDSVAKETDHIVDVLNHVALLHEQAVVFLRKHGLPVAADSISAAATEEYLLGGAGFAPGQSPQLPAEADPAQAPVEIWVHHKVPALLIGLGPILQTKLDEDWARIKPKISERIARYSPEVAKLFDETGHKVELTPLSGDRDWHVIRFAKKFHTVTTQGRPR